jgi:hypothetical protein
VTDRPAICIIFDGHPGPEGPRFVEVERPDGHSIRIGTWEPDPHHPECWRLRITDADMLAEVRLQRGEEDEVSSGVTISDDTDILITPPEGD